MPAFFLKVGATALTLLAAVASAAYVGAHPKNPNAPLHPHVAGTTSLSTARVGGRLVLTPSVRAADVEAITSTYAS